MTRQDAHMCQMVVVVVVVSLVLVMMTTVTTMIDDGGDDGDVFSLCKGCLIAMVWNCWGVSPRCSINQPVQPPKNGVHPKDFLLTLNLILSTCKDGLLCMQKTEVRS